MRPRLRTRWRRRRRWCHLFARSSRSPASIAVRSHERRRGHARGAQGREAGARRRGDTRRDGGGDVSGCARTADSSSDSIRRQFAGERAWLSPPARTHPYGRDVTSRPSPPRACVHGGGRAIAARGAPWCCRGGQRGCQHGSCVGCPPVVRPLLSSSSLSLCAWAATPMRRPSSAAQTVGHSPMCALTAGPLHRVPPSSLDLCLEPSSPVSRRSSLVFSPKQPDSLPPCPRGSACLPCARPSLGTRV
jgi:hypothetical protein